LVLISPRDFKLSERPHVPILAFAAGCSYRRRLEAWLATQRIAPGRVMEYGSYHAMVACVAAGGGIALVPRSVLNGMKANPQIRLQSLPAETALAKTHLVWR